MVFKNNAPFINCISKINGVKLDNAEDLDVVMLMYNLLEYSKNYRKITGSLWNYYRDETNSGTDANNITHLILNLESFDYKVDFMESGVTQNNVTNNNVKIAEPLKHLSNLTWFRNCVLTGKSARDANYNANPHVSKIDNPENAIFQITDTKLYVPVVTLLRETDIKLIEQLKTGF